MLAVSVLPTLMVAVGSTTLPAAYRLGDRRSAERNRVIERRIEDVVVRQESLENELLSWRPSCRWQPCHR